MKTEQIEQRLMDINNEIHSLDSLRDGHDDVNIHIIEEQIDSLLTERQKLTELLESCFDDLIGL
jgi:archaellum component FlaC